METDALDTILIPDRAAAAIAGVSRATWHRLRAADKLPPTVRLGRCVRWRRDEVVKWVQAGCPDGRTWAAMQACSRRSKGAMGGGTSKP